MRRYIHIIIILNSELSGDSGNVYISRFVGRYLGWSLQPIESPHRKIAYSPIPDFKTYAGTGESYKSRSSLIVHFPQYSHSYGLQINSAHLFSVQRRKIWSRVRVRSLMLLRDAATAHAVNVLWPRQNASASLKTPLPNVSGMAVLQRVEHIQQRLI